MIKNYKLRHFIKKFSFLKTYNSPFKPPGLRLYIGKTKVGTPYFLPRVWVKSKTRPGSLSARNKKIGFDFVGLGWKTKWTNTDYRFEWSPVWSFVFFGFQIAITFVPVEPSHYWECWLYYINNTDKTKSTKERLEQARKDFPCVWTSYSYQEGVGQKNIQTCYWDVILKDKWL